MLNKLHLRKEKQMGKVQVIKKEGKTSVPNSQTDCKWQQKLPILNYFTGTEIRKETKSISDDKQQILLWDSVNW